MSAPATTTVTVMTGAIEARDVNHTLRGGEQWRVIRRIVSWSDEEEAYRVEAELELVPDDAA